MPKPLPARPNLEHLRAQAKALLTRFREGDAKAVRTFAAHLPDASNLAEEVVRKMDLRLADAQLAIARKSGFAGWPGLARYVDRLRSMEGKWAFRSLETDGMVIPSAMLSHSFLLIDGDRFRMESPEATYEGVFTIDVELLPHRIDIDFVEGPEAGNRCEGLFELDGDSFKICLSLAGAKRPEGFATTPGSGHALEHLVRVEQARPVGVDGGTPQPRPESPVPATAEEAGDFAGSIGPSLQRLQGEWVPLELINSGVPLQKSYLPFGSRIHSGAETRVVFGGQSMVHAKVRINEETTPLEIDYLNLAGRGAGSLSLGLFRWEEEQAGFLYRIPGCTSAHRFHVRERQRANAEPLEEEGLNDGLPGKS